MTWIIIRWTTGICWGYNQDITKYWSFPRLDEFVSFCYIHIFPSPPQKKSRWKNVGKKGADEGDARTRPLGQNDNLCSQSFTTRDFNVHTLPKDRRETHTRRGRKKARKRRGKRERKKRKKPRGRSGMRERDAETIGVTRKSRLGRVKFAGCLSPLTHSHPPDRPSFVPPALSSFSTFSRTPLSVVFLFSFYYFTSDCVSESGVVLLSARREPAVVAPFEM